MWLSVALLLLAGASLGVLGDRLVLGGPVALAGPLPEDRPLFFVCGGGSLDVEQEPSYFYPERFRRRLLERLSLELEMTPEQKDELEMMLELGRTGAREFWEDLRHAYCDVRDAFRAQIREILEPEQKVRFDIMMADVDRLLREQNAIRVPRDERQPTD